MKYPKYATTVIGAHSVPDWYEALDRLVAVGQLSMASMGTPSSGLARPQSSTRKSLALT